MTKQRRIFAVVLAALAVLIVLSASVFMIEHAGHECVGEDCPICAQIYACAENLKNLAAVAAVVFAAAAFAAALRVCADGELPVYVPRTPVSLKVKLSN